MAIDAETTRLMTNWAQWRAGASVALAMSGAYDAAVRDTYDTPMPLLNGEALEVNQAVEGLEASLAKAVTEFWCYSGNAAEKARRCGCALGTLYRRLDQAHAGVHAYRRELVARAQRIRKALSLAPAGGRLALALSNPRG